MKIREQVHTFTETKLKSMRTANYTDLRTNLKGYIDSVIDDCETVIVNRDNGSGVVLISLDEYNSLKETEYIISSPQTMEDIRQGEADLKTDKGIEVDINSL